MLTWMRLESMKVLKCWLKHSTWDVLLQNSSADQFPDSVQLSCPGSSEQLSPALRRGAREHLVQEPAHVIHTSLSHTHIHTCMIIYIYILYTHTHTHIHTCIYIYIYIPHISIYVRVCICIVCVNILVLLLVC